MQPAISPGGGGGGTSYSEWTIRGGGLTFKVNDFFNIEANATTW